MTSLLRRRADGVGVPLEGGDGGDVDEDVVARLEGEVRRPLDHQRHHLRERENIQMLAADRKIQSEATKPSSLPLREG